jgi:7-cyano-7-deazaguanine synthase in queuosine biosynthesis
MQVSNHRACKTRNAEERKGRLAALSVTYNTNHTIRYKMKCLLQQQLRIHMPYINTSVCRIHHPNPATRSAARLPKSPLLANMPRMDMHPDQSPSFSSVILVISASPSNQRA